MTEAQSRTMWRSLVSKLRHVTLREFDYNVHISLQHRLLYVETPKVACSSIKLTLSKLELQDPEYFREDIHDRYLSPLLRPSQVGDFDRFLQRDDVVKFCFVRNPYERLLSSYLNKVGGRDKAIFPALLCQLGRDQTDYSHEISFEEFIECIERMPVSMMNAHWRPQYYQTFQDTLQYDLVGRLETLDNDFQKLGELISFDLSPYLESWNIHKTGSRDKFKDYYSEALLERVYALYRIDFDTFGYSPGEPGL